MVSVYRIVRDFRCHGRGPAFGGGRGVRDQPAPHHAAFGREQKS
jgi:hypothetical protein